jgi:hypothetical protein
MPVGPNVDGDLRVVASPTERIERLKPVSLAGDEFVRDSLAVAQPHLVPPSDRIRRSPPTRIDRRKLLSDSLAGICRLIDVDTVAVAWQASTHGIAHGSTFGNDRPAAPDRELRARS